MTPTLVAGYDGSPAAEAAVRWAARRAAAADGRLVVVHATRAGTPRAARAAQRERARTRLDALYMEDAALVDAELELVVADAPPVEALLRTAAHVGAEAIVVGRHHGGALQGDTVRRLLDAADRPVTVIPPAAMVGACPPPASSSASG